MHRHVLRRMPQSIMCEQGNRKPQDKQGLGAPKAEDEQRCDEFRANNPHANGEPWCPGQYVQPQVRMSKNMSKVQTEINDQVPATWV